MTRTRIATAKIVILAAALAAAMFATPAPASASPWCGLFPISAPC